MDVPRGTIQHHHALSLIREMQVGSEMDVWSKSSPTIPFLDNLLEYCRMKVPTALREQILFLYNSTNSIHCHCRQ